MLEERDDGARYLMLETIREYAREKLAQRGDAGGDRGAALRPLLRAGQGGAATACRGPQQADWLWRVEVELDNIRSAIALSLAGRRRSVHRRQVRGRDAGLLDPARLLDRRPQARAGGAGAAGDPGVADRPGLRALRRCGAGREPERPCRGAQDARDLPRAAARRWATRSTSPPPCRRCRWPGFRPAMPSRPRAGESEALEIFRRLGDRVGEAIGLLHLGPDLRCTGATTRRPARTSSSAWRSPARSVTRRSRANASWCSARSRSRRAIGPGLPAVQALADGVSRSRRQARRGERAALAGAGRPAGWRPRVGAGAPGRCLARLPRLRDARGAARLPRGPRRARRAEGDPVRAVRVLSTATVSRTRLGLAAAPRAERRHQDLKEALQRALPDDAFAAAWNEGARRRARRCDPSGDRGPRRGGAGRHRLNPRAGRRGVL